jgi:hypothetical protein
VDIHLSELTEGAQITLTCPTTASVTLFRGATPLTIPTAANIVNDAGTFPGRTINSQATGGGVSTINLTVEGPPAVAEYWLIRVGDLGLSPCTITEGANADIVRVLADPAVTVTPLGTVVEKAPIALNGTAEYRVVESAAPPAGLPALPPLAARGSQLPSTVAADRARRWLVAGHWSSRPRLLSPRPASTPRSRWTTG